MRHMVFALLSLLVSASLLAKEPATENEDIRISAKEGCVCHGSLLYGDNYGYELNFESESLDLQNGKGEGRLIRLMIVVPAKGNKPSALPPGEFALGSCDSVVVGAIEYFESSVEYYGMLNDRYDQPDKRVAFVQCNVRIDKQKGGKSGVVIRYELTNGEKGEYQFSGKVKLQKDNRKRQYQYMPRQPYIKNWELTKAGISVIDTTAFGSRRAALSFECAYDLLGYLILYLPMDSVNGRYEMRYGKESGFCEVSQGGFMNHGEFLFSNGGIDDFVTGLTYYPLSGYVIISDEKLFLEFLTRDGSTVRCVYRGKVAK